MDFGLQNVDCGFRIAGCGLLWNSDFGAKKMNSSDMKRKTMQFGLDIIKLVESLPRGRTADVVGKQLLRSGVSVGANYRSACRARSTADFISKMGIVEEEADESMYWMELLVESGIVGFKAVE